MCDAGCAVDRQDLAGLIGIFSLLALTGCADGGASESDDENLTQVSAKLTFVVAKDCRGALPNEAPYHVAISPVNVFTLQQSALTKAGLDYKNTRVHATRITGGKRYDLGAFSPTSTLKFSVAPQDWSGSSFELDFRELTTASTKVDAPTTLKRLYRMGVFEGNWLSDEWSMPVQCSK